MPLHVTLIGWCSNEDCQFTNYPCQIYIFWILTISDVKFGNLACYFNETFADQDDVNGTLEQLCKDTDDNTTCINTEQCYWDYSGSGIEYQILAGPAFIAVFTFSNIITGLTSDRIAGNAYSNLNA